MGSGNENDDVGSNFSWDGVSKGVECCVRARVCVHVMCASVCTCVCARACVCVHVMCVSACASACVMRIANPEN